MSDIFTSIEEHPIQPEGKSFGIRAGAYIIDMVVYSALIFIVQFIVGFLIGIVLIMAGRELHFDEESLQGFFGFIIGLIRVLLYFAIFEWLFGATLGKVILGMRVVMENGESCSFTAAFTRGLIRYVDGLFFGIPAYRAMKAPLYQRIGDKSAKTAVVSTGSPIIKQRRAWWWFIFATGLYLTLDATIAFFTTIIAIR